MNAANGQPMLVELKSGETINGHLVNCDSWMNLLLKEVVLTSSDGESFTQIPEYYVRGNLIKYLRIPDELIDKINEQNQQQRNENRNYNNHQHNNRNYNNQNNNYRGRGRGGRGGSRGGYRHNNYNQNNQNNQNNHNHNNQHTNNQGNVNRNYNNQNQRY